MASELERTGFFSAFESTNVGDRYTTRNGPPGKQILTTKPLVLVNGQKWGKQTPDAFIDKEYRRLSEGDPYMSEYQREKRDFLERKSRFVSDKPFRPSNPAKKSINPGGTDGCIGEVPLTTECLPFRDKGKPGKGLKNFTVGAPKSKPAGYPLDMRIIGAIPEYMVEPYHPAKAIDKEIKKAARERIVKPWGAGGIGGRLFDSTLHNSLGGSRDAGLKRPHTVHGKPFTPSSPTRKGNYAYGKLSDTNYACWNGEPYVDSYKLNVKKPGQMGAKPFRPPQSTKTTYTPGINPYSYDAKPPLPEIVN